MSRPGNIVFFFTLVLVLSSLSLAEPPSTDEIRRLISAANVEWEKDEAQSRELRMQFELSGRLPSEKDKTFFFELAENAKKQLDLLVSQQQSMLNEIEKYEGNDWDKLYGSTGLWRQLAASIEKNKLNKAQIEYHIALVCDDSQKQKALEEILSQLQSPSADLMKAKILCALSRIDEKYSKPVEEQFFRMRLRSDLSHCDAIRVSIEQIKCLGPSEPNEMNNLAQSLYESECKEDNEMLLSLAMLQRRYSPDALVDTLSRSWYCSNLFGKLLLADMSAHLSQTPTTDANLDSFSPLDAEIAAITVLQANLQSYAELTGKLADNERFQSPAVLYAAAEFCRQARPLKAIELLIKASNLQVKNLNKLFRKPAEEIAQKAFGLGYEQFTENPNDCQPAIDAYENYSRVSPDKIDEQTQYLYAVLLNNCSRQNEAAEVFRALAKQSKSLWDDAANLELLKIELNRAAEPNEVLDRLRDFILGCTGPEDRATQLRLEAMDLYCESLLNQDSSVSAEKVLYILDNARPTPCLRYEFFRAMAFKQLGRLEESAHFMALALNANKGPFVFPVSLLPEILDKIELWQQNARDFNEMLENCDRLAQYANQLCNDRKAFLDLAEIDILRGKRCREPFFSNDPNDISWRRPYARLLMTQDNFAHAALLWSELAEIKRNDLTKPNQKTYGWWQAKFYELDCLAKLPSAKPQDLRHTIEVLQNTYADIPAPWAEKLNGLKELLGNSI